jgi:RNA polymerase sigma factor (sigma-70 family)
MTPRRLIEPARLAGSALLHTQSDERLVDLARAGNDRAFEAIVARYRSRLLRHCAGILPPERAEDAVQQAFLNAYRAITAGEAEIALRPWLYRVAHNASLNLLRQNGWNHEQIPEDFDGVVQPPQAVEQSEHLRQVVRSVKDLPERQRDAIVLRELEGRSYEEIAAALGVTDGAVRQLLNRARTALRTAATSITPPQLLERLADRAAVDTPAAARIAELSMGAGGAATLAKIGAAVVVAGAVAGGVAAGPLRHAGADRGSVAEAAEFAQPGGGGGAGAAGGFALADPFGTQRGRGAGAGVLAQALDLARQGGSGAATGAFGSGGLQGPGGGGSVLGGPGTGGTGSGTSGPSLGGDRGGNSGPGGGGGDGSSHSGHGSGDEHSGSGSSGSGSSDGGNNSGSGSSGDGSSGSGSSGDGSSGSGSGSGDGGGDGSSSSGSGSSGDGGGDSSGSGLSGSGSSGSASGGLDGGLLDGSGSGSGDSGHSGPG